LGCIFENEMRVNYDEATRCDVPSLSTQLMTNSCGYKKATQRLQQRLKEVPYRAIALLTMNSPICVLAPIVFDGWAAASLIDGDGNCQEPKRDS
jgi:hypothetical protein